MPSRTDDERTSSGWTRLAGRSSVASPSTSGRCARRLPAAVRRPGRRVRRLPAHRRRGVLQMYAVTGSSLWVGLIGLAALGPLVVLGLYGGSVSDAVDRRTLLIWSSLVAWAVTGGLLLQSLLGDGNQWVLLALVAVQSGGFAMSAPTRGALVPRLLPVAAGARRQHADVHDEQPGHRARAADRRVWCWCAPATPWAYGIDALLFTAGPVRGCAAAVRPAARGEHPAGTALGGRGSAVHQQPAGAADVVRRRHRGDGLRHAARAVPGDGATTGSAARPAPAGCTRRSASVRSSAAWRPAGSGGSTGRGSRWCSRWRRGARRWRSPVSRRRCGWSSCCSPSPARPTWCRRSTGRRSCRPTRRTRCAAGCRACSSSSSPAARGWVTCGPVRALRCRGRPRRGSAAASPAWSSSCSSRRSPYRRRRWCATGRRRS